MEKYIKIKWERLAEEYSASTECWGPEIKSDPYRIVLFQQDKEKEKKEILYGHSLCFVKERERERDKKEKENKRKQVKGTCVAGRMNHRPSTCV